MTITTRFGKKLKLPSTFQLKHQFLLFWQKEQLAKEAAESETAERVASRDEAATPIQAARFAPRPLAGAKVRTRKLATTT